MKPISELIHEDSAWSMIQNWIHESDRPVIILENTRQAGEEVLHKLQVSNKSTMGSIALECGGMIIDHGWLRILGSGHIQMPGSLIDLNDSNPYFEGFVIAYDILGGVFALNTGYFDDASHHVYYFAPDTLEWEDTEKGYSDFIYWVFHGSLDDFYQSFRWDHWMEDVQKLNGGQGFSVYPYLWSEQASDINKCHIETVPLQEIWGLNNEFKHKFKA